MNMFCPGSFVPDAPRCDGILVSAIRGWLVSLYFQTLYLYLLETLDSKAVGILIPDSESGAN